MTTIACTLGPDVDPADPNTVKVLVGAANQAIYFSRAAVPYMRTPGPAPVYHHLGLYAFTREFLTLYSSLSPTPLEQCESLEQLRVLEHGYAIEVGLVDELTLEINTPEDYAQAQAMLEGGRR
jgi:3-deoxy-manno-octulosonate cytidylyltransferase (CMP-KDO synthetase)